MPVRSATTSSQSRYTRIDAEEGIPLQYISQYVNDEHNVVSAGHSALGLADGRPAGDHEISTPAPQHTQQDGELGITRLREPSTVSNIRLSQQSTSGGPLGSYLSVIPSTPGFVDIDLSLGGETLSYRTGGSVSSEPNQSFNNSRSSMARNFNLDYDNDNDSRVHLRQDDADLLQGVRQTRLPSPSRTQPHGARHRWIPFNTNVFKYLRNAFQEMAARVMRPEHTPRTQLNGPRIDETLVMPTEITPDVLEVRSTVHLDWTTEVLGERERQSTFPELPFEQHPTNLSFVNMARTACGKLRGIYFSSIALVILEQFTFILIILQTCIIVTETALGLATQGRSLMRPVQWTTITLVVVFALFTVEVCTKAVRFGFMFNRSERGFSDRVSAHWFATVARLKSLMRLSNQDMPSGVPLASKSKTEPPFLPHVLYPNAVKNAPDCSDLNEDQSATEQAFLRRPGSVLDLIAISSFWLDITFGSLEIESTGKLGLLRALSCLRMARLLNFTKGTLAITRDIRRIAQMSLLVGLLIAFYCLLFAIAGVHSFQSGLSRRCVWDGTRADPTQSNMTSTQLCDRWSTMNGSEVVTMPWLNRDGLPALETYGGYICPVGAWCVEGNSMYEGIAGFDNLWSSLVMVFVLLTGRSFTGTMYSLTESNGLAAVMYFVAGFVILRLWLINIFVATVITSSQAFKKASYSDKVTDPVGKTRPPGIGTVSRWQERFRPILDSAKRLRGLPLVAIVFNMIVKSLRHDKMGEQTADLIWWSEVSTVLILDIEIALRFLHSSRHHRRFRYQDWVDLTIAIVTTSLLIPPLRHSGRVYDWLSGMQVLRVYRVVLVLSVVRALTIPLVTQIPALFNLILYMMMSSILVAILATQLFWDRSLLSGGSPDAGPPVDLATIHGALLSMYQVALSETWSNVLFDSIRYDTNWYTVCISVAFFFVWFVIMSLTILNMFVASVQKAFHSDEEQKRLQQVRRFLQQKEFDHATPAMHDFFKRRGKKLSGQVTFGSVSSDMMLRDSVMRDFLDDVDDSDDESSECVDLTRSSAPSFGANKLQFLTGLGRKYGRVLFDLEPNPFYSGLEFTKPVEDLAPSALAKEVVEITENQTIAQRQYLLSHPYYDTSLFLFSQSSRFRNLCQKAVRPGRGHARYQGATPGPVLSLVFSIFGYMLIVSMVIIACVATPWYKKVYFARRGYSRQNEFVFVEVGFATLFTVEAFVRVVADGFFWTPNAYLRSFWGVTDVIAILSMWINAILLLEVSSAYGAQAIGAFKALKVLRLLEIKDRTIRNYTSAFISGKRSLLAIVCIALGLLSAFAVWGLQLFSGRIYSCNDTTPNLTVLTECVGEYVNAPYEWTLLMPRHIKTSNFPFDDFASAMLTVFRSTSENSWLSEHTGTVFTQPTVSALSELSAFFLIYKLLSGILVITLLVSIVMQNYMEQTGTAFLSREQRSWRELHKHLGQIRPYRRIFSDRRSCNHRVRRWCARVVRAESNPWHRMITLVLMVHVVLLCIGTCVGGTLWTTIRLSVSTALMTVYMADVLIHIIGESWSEYKRNAWNLYCSFTISCAAVAGLLLLTATSNYALSQFHMTMLLCVISQLVTRNRYMDHIFRLAVTTFTHIVDLLAVWLIMFLVYAIALTQTFGLTKSGDGSLYLNFRTVPIALSVLLKLSTGEGWGGIMEEFAHALPPFCTVGERYFDSDCASPEWAYVLFISWNIISMYLFASMFISSAVESFSYVYGRSSRLSRVKRADVQQFRDAWAELDPGASGFIATEALPKLLGKLLGAFETNIHGEKSTLRHLMASSGSGVASSPFVHASRVSTHAEIDLHKLRALLDDIPVGQIREQRVRVNTLRHTILTSADPVHGIGFNFLLVLLVHHQLNNTDKHLGLHEFLQHRARLQRAEEASSREVIIRFFETIYWSRRFRRRRARTVGNDSILTDMPSTSIWERFHKDGNA